MLETIKAIIVAIILIIFIIIIFNLEDNNLNNQNLYNNENNYYIHYKKDDNSSIKKDDNSFIKKDDNSSIKKDDNYNKKNDNDYKKDNDYDYNRKDYNSFIKEDNNYNKKDEYKYYKIINKKSNSNKCKDDKNYDENRNIINNKKKIYDSINCYTNNKENNYIFINKYYNNNYSYNSNDNIYTKSNDKNNYLNNFFFDKNEYFLKKNLKDKKEYWYMYELPDIKKRLIIFDTEVTGKTEKDRIIELCAREMINGLLTGKKFHSFLKPKYKMSPYLIKLHKIPKKAFYYTSEEEKSILQNFLKFINNSLIITHNASYDMEKINKELKYNDLPLINRFRFRCSMRIFLERFSDFSKKFSKLKECCEFLKIRYSNQNLHTAVYDTFILGKIMEKIYKNEIIKDNHNLNKIFLEKKKSGNTELKGEEIANNERKKEENDKKGVNLINNKINGNKNKNDLNIDKERIKKKTLELLEIIDNNEIIKDIFESLEKEDKKFLGIKRK